MRPARRPRRRRGTHEAQGKVVCAVEVAFVKLCERVLIPATDARGEILIRDVCQRRRHRLPFPRLVTRLSTNIASGQSQVQAKRLSPEWLHPVPAVGWWKLRIDRRL